MFRHLIPTTNEDQMAIVDDIFHILDKNEDDVVSVDDVKLIAQQIVPLIFALLDQNDDGTLSINDVELSIQWKDLNNILVLFEPNKEIDFNRYLIPFGLDVTKDGQINNLDVYLICQSYRSESSLDWIPRVLKLLDQNQDGIYTSVQLRQFVEKIWGLLDANKDKNLSLEDGYIILKTNFSASEDNIVALKAYVDSLTLFIKTSFQKHATDCLFPHLDINSNDEITKEEIINAPDEITVEEQSCIGKQRFPEFPSILLQKQFFPSSPYLRNLGLTPWISRLTAFAMSSLDSSTFYETISMPKIRKP